ncbi:MAG: ABC transporter ATP-binding protein [Burkholderiales bacterium]|nr:ABC transporter ATP-binding protein [Burkholderiales bacterium]
MLLTINNLHVSYGAIQALRGVSLNIEQGEIVTLIGSNGAGKTTLLRTISGLLAPTEGSIVWNDAAQLQRRPPHEITRTGIIHVPEGRQIFANLSVKENLLIGAYQRTNSREIAADIDHCYAQFPILHERQNQKAGTLSGGEQQMLALARALMGRPRLLLADEVSLGLAPVITKQVFGHLQALREQGITIVVVEQNAHLVMKMADHVYVLKHGRLVMHGTPAELASRRELTEAYLGE